MRGEQELRGAQCKSVAEYVVLHGGTLTNARTVSITADAEVRSGS